MKKCNEQEVVEVLSNMSVSAKAVLKNVKKKDLHAVEEAEQMLGKLKVKYALTAAAE